MFDRNFITHAEDASLVEDGVMHEGEVIAPIRIERGDHLWPRILRWPAILLLAEYADAAVHIAHIKLQKSCGACQGCQGSGA